MRGHTLYINVRNSCTKYKFVSTQWFLARKSIFLLQTIVRTRMEAIASIFKRQQGIALGVVSISFFNLFLLNAIFDVPKSRCLKSK